MKRKAEDAQDLFRETPSDGQLFAACCQPPIVESITKYLSLSDIVSFARIRRCVYPLLKKHCVALKLSTSLMYICKTDAFIPALCATKNRQCINLATELIISHRDNHYIYNMLFRQCTFELIRMDSCGYLYEFQLQCSPYCTLDMDDLIKLFLKAVKFICLNNPKMNILDFFV